MRQMLQGWGSTVWQFIAGRVNNHADVYPVLSCGGQSVGGPEEQINSLDPGVKPLG